MFKLEKVSRSSYVMRRIHSEPKDLRSGKPSIWSLARAAASAKAPQKLQQGPPRETLNMVTSECEKGFAMELNVKKPPVGA